MSDFFDFDQNEEIPLDAILVTGVTSTAFIDNGDEEEEDDDVCE